jgi:hypothetical protein
MAVTLLPKFIDNPVGGTPATQRGAWIQAEFGELASISNNLDVPKSFRPNVFVDAIPDIWGKSLVFAYALRDGTHQFHNQAVASFRGFLTMLALRLRRNYRIEIARVDMTQAKGKFIEAVCKLLPQATLADGVEWNPVTIFLLDDEVVGITSPLTLIAPREGADMPRAAARGLTDGFRFRDPISTLTTVEAVIVQRWVEELSNSVSMLPLGHAKWITDVCTVLNAFAADLKARAAGVQAIYARSDKDNLDLRGAWAGLASAAAKSDQMDSMVQLVAQKGPVAKQLLIYDPEIPQKWKVEATSVEIINGVTMAAIAGISPGNTRNVLAGHPLPPGYEWNRPEEFLLEKLTVVKSRDAFAAVRQIDGAQELAAKHGFSPLLPIDEKLIPYLEADYIETSCYFREVANGIEFSLQLPVDAGKHAITAKRVYRFEELVRKDAILLPVMEVWPGYKSDTWKAYFTFWANDQQSDRLYIRPSDVPVAAKKTVEPESGPMEKEVYQLEQPPEFLTCIETAKKPGAAPEAVLGLLLPAYESPKQKLGADFQIGFDFGTTNTHIFTRRGQEAPKPLQLLARGAQICRPDREFRVGHLCRFFIPPASDEGGAIGAETAPFLSLLRRRSVKPTGDLSPIRDAHVFYYSLLSEHYDPLKDGNILAHLKWQPEHDMNVARDAFLSQLALHAALEAVREGASKITFYYSYPTAFTPIMLESFRNAWAQIVTNLPGEIGIPCELGQRQTESVAASYYFTKIPYAAKALAGRGTLVADIGGGTTDISIWKQLQLQIQSSLRLSGREILLDPLLSLRTTLLPKICLGMNIDSVVEPMLTAGESMFFRRADALLKTHGDKIVSQLGNLLGDPDYDLLRSQMTIRLGGLFYYIGLMLRSCGWDPKKDDFLPHTYVGGNGCRILSWLAPPVYASDHPIHGFLRNALASGAGMTTPPENLLVIVSREPKSESACGLLYSSTNELNVADGFKKCIIAGEPFQYGETPWPATAAMKTSEICCEKGIQYQGPVELKQYLELYNAFAAGSGAVVLALTNPAAVLQQARENVLNWCIEQARSQDKDAVEVEPLFVLGLLRSLQFAEWRPRTYGVSV